MPIPSVRIFEFTTHGPEQTRQLGMRLGRSLQRGGLVCLQGELGAGKTTFVQGVAEGWGSLDAVSSPTFLLVNLYRRADGEQLFHFDTYRIESILEAEELDLEGMLADGALLVEWPERIERLLPRERLWIRFDYADDSERRLTASASGGHAENLLAALGAP